MKVYRDWRISGDTEWLRGLWPKVKAQPRITASRPGTRAAKAGSRNRTTTPTTSSSGARTACAPASTWARSRRPSLMGQGPGRERRRSTRAVRERGAAHGAGTVRRRILHPEDRVEEPARQEPARRQELRRRLFARSPGTCWRRRGRNTSTAMAVLLTVCWARGWRWSAAWARCWTAEKVASHLQRGSPIQPKAGPVRSCQSAAAQLRLRRRGRPAALHLAQRRRAFAAVRLFRRGLDRASNTRWLRTSC